MYRFSGIEKIQHMVRFNAANQPNSKDSEEL